MEPEFSIVIPTYNRAHFLDVAIESVLNQTYPNWELIVVDDGSTDNTKELVHGYIETDKRVKYVFQENAERSRARNNGIDHARGSWICFLDSDDHFTPDHLFEMKNLIKGHEGTKGIYFSGLLKKFDDAEELHVSYDTSGKTPTDFVFLNSLATPRACVHSSLLERERFNPNIKIGEDKELWMRIASTFPVFYHSHPTVVQVEHHERSINDDGKASLENLSTIRYILRSKSSETLSAKAKNKGLSAAYQNRALSHLRRSNRTAAISFILKAIIADLRNPQLKFRINVLTRLLFFKPMSEIILLFA